MEARSAAVRRGAASSAARGRLVPLTGLGIHEVLERALYQRLHVSRSRSGIDHRRVRRAVDMDGGVRTAGDPGLELRCAATPRAAVDRLRLKPAAPTWLGRADAVSAPTGGRSATRLDLDELAVVDVAFVIAGEIAADAGGCRAGRALGHGAVVGQRAIVRLVQVGRWAVPDVVAVRFRPSVRQGDREGADPGAGGRDLGRCHRGDIDVIPPQNVGEDRTHRVSAGGPVVHAHAYLPFGDQHVDIRVLHTGRRLVDGVSGGVILRPDAGAIGIARKGEEGGGAA